jgi:hypothetical protein
MLVESAKGWEGFVSACGLEFYVNLRSDGALEGDSELELLLASKLSDLQSLSRKLSLLDFESEISSALSSALRKRFHSAPPPPSSSPPQQLEQQQQQLSLSAPQPGFFRHAAHDVASVGWHKLAPVSHSLAQLRLETEDSSARSNYFSLTLPPSYPHSGIISVDCSLPGTRPPALQSQSTIQQAVSVCEQLCEQWRPVFDALAELDRLLLVMEPREPTLSDLHRRVQLTTSSGGALHFCLNDSPERALAFPATLRLIGSEEMVAPLRASISVNASTWVDGRSLVENLENLIASQLPRKAELDGNSGANVGSGVECSICYCNRIPQDDGSEGPLPEEPCQNPKCGRVYHHGCLADWLRSEGARRAYDTLIGACPYCSSAVTLVA